MKTKSIIVLVLVLAGGLFLSLIALCAEVEAAQPLAQRRAPFAGPRKESVASAATRRPI